VEAFGIFRQLDFGSGSTTFMKFGVTFNTF